MTTLARDQLAQLATAAGFRGDAVATMVAIVLAESGGNARAHNTNAGTGDNSYGLAQINMLGNLGPARRAQLGISSNDQLFDPATNLRAAYALSGGGTNFGPWSTYKSGAYKSFLGGAQGAKGGWDPPGDWTTIPGVPFPVPDVGGGAGDAIGGAIANAFGAAVEPFVTGLRRLSIIGVALLAGTALVVAGAWRGVRPAT